MIKANDVQLETAKLQGRGETRQDSPGDDKQGTTASRSEDANGQYDAGDVLSFAGPSTVAPKLDFRSLFGVLKLSHGPDLPRSHPSLDLLTTIFSFAAMHWLTLGSLNLTSDRTIVLFGSTLILWMAMCAGGMYGQKRLRNLSGEVTTLLLCWMYAFAAVGLFVFLTKTAETVSRVWTTSSMFLALASLVFIRAAVCLELVAGNKAKARNVLICGNESRISTIMQSLHKVSSSKIRIARIFELPNLPAHTATSSDLLRTSVNQITHFVEKKRLSGDAIEQVWIAVSANQSQLVDEFSEALINSSVDVCVVPDLYTQRLLNGDFTRYGETKIVNISEISLAPSADRFKRIFDVCLASAALLVFLIPMIVIAALIKLETPGPALFRQKRYGVDGREIEILKFRSMRVHTDRHVRQATRNDQRVTRTGKFLRESSLDELPQLLNVLKGSMSLVGPRPHAVAHNEIWRSQINGYMLRHKVRPGITGWAQVNGWRGETDQPFKMHQRVKFDLEYIRNWSPWFDVKILFYTVAKGFLNKNAY